MDTNDSPPTKKTKKKNSSKTKHSKVDTPKTNRITKPNKSIRLKKLTGKTPTKETNKNKDKFCNLRQTDTIEGTSKHSTKTKKSKNTEVPEQIETNSTQVQLLTSTSIPESHKAESKLQLTKFISSFVPVSMINSNNFIQTRKDTPEVDAEYDLHDSFHAFKTVQNQTWHTSYHTEVGTNKTHSGSKNFAQANNPQSSVFSSMNTAHFQTQTITIPYLLPGSLSSNPMSVYRAQNILSQIQPSINVGSSVDSREYCSHSSSSRDGRTFSSDTHPCPELTETCRSWQTIQQSDAKVEGLEFTVMSYNILSQELLQRHMHLYSNCKESDLQWSTRGQALLTQIIAHNADIVCLQEVEENHWLHYIKTILSEKGYYGVFKMQKGGDKPDGCAILFKVSKFNLFKYIPVEFMKGGILDRRNVGIIVILQPHPAVYGGNVKKLCIATTHLLFNPQRGDIKLAQLVLFLAEIDKHAYLDDDISDGSISVASNSSTVDVNTSKEHAQVSDRGGMSELSGRCDESHSKQLYCPIILCGDFNTEPFSHMYKFITSGHLKYDRLISRLVCGQKEGQMWGNNRTVDKKILPNYLSINETCQYIEAIQKRQSKSQHIAQNFQMNSGQVFHSMNFLSVYSHLVDQLGQKKEEITSRHNSCSCTVDYIFYSTSGVKQQLLDPSLGTHSGDNSTDSRYNNKRDTCRHNENELNKEQLVLLARYSLLTSKQVAIYGSMPNSTFPSDHLCLIAKFLLR